MLDAELRGFTELEGFICEFVGLILHYVDYSTFAITNMAPANSWLGYYFDAPFQHSDKLVYLTRPQLSLKHHEQQILGPANDCLVSGFKSKAG